CHAEGLQSSLQAHQSCGNGCVGRKDPPSGFPKSEPQFLCLFLASCPLCLCGEIFFLRDLPPRLQFTPEHASKELVSLWHDPKARLILLANFLLVVGSGITWIAVPWLLIHQPDGETLYGISNAVLTLLIFVLLPYLGKVIDRTSRK